MWGLEPLNFVFIFAFGGCDALVNPGNWEAAPEEISKMVPGGPGDSKKPTKKWDSSLRKYARLGGTVESLFALWVCDDSLAPA